MPLKNRAGKPSETRTLRRPWGVHMGRCPTRRQARSRRHQGSRGPPMGRTPVSFGTKQAMRMVAPWAATARRGWTRERDNEELSREV